MGKNKTFSHDVVTEVVEVAEATTTIRIGNIDICFHFDEFGRITSNTKTTNAQVLDEGALEVTRFEYLRALRRAYAAHNDFLRRRARRN